MEESVLSFVNEKAEEFLRLYKIMTSAYWNATLSGKDDDYKAVAESEISMKKFFNSEIDFEKVKEFLKSSTDKDLARQLKLLYYAYLSNQGGMGLLTELSNKTSAVEQKFNIFRAEINGEKVNDSKINDILKNEKNSSKLEVAWSGHKKVGEIVKDDVLEIVKLRNKLAVSLGFNNYYEFSLEVSEQKESEVEKVFDELDSMTREPFAKLKEEVDLKLAEKYDIAVSDLKPWHYGDLFFQEGPAIYSVDLNEFYADDILEKAKKYYPSLGMDVSDILERSNLYEQEGKYPHAYCIDMDRSGDVRSMQNIRNDEKYMDTMLHELGHAVYWKYMDFDLPIILRDTAHTFVTEAVAMIFGRKAKSLDFINNVCSKEVDSNLGDEISRILRLRQIVFSRWTQVMFRFERELYKNPEQDLDALWWRLVKKYQLIDFSREKPDWASKIHIVSCPVYYHNYMLGELLASQLHNYIMKNFDCGDSYFGCSEVGDYFKEKIFRQGIKYRWDELVERATGEKLTAKYFVDEFV
ncbi:M2 family metallopeptidase [Candidatus Pacearchaeota archaeon]|nr:M2 family metallopeptidase [Candidatus Pacearchaeota archaeon]